MPLHTMPSAATEKTISGAGMAAKGGADRASGISIIVAAHMLPWALAKGSTDAAAVSYTHLDVYKRQPNGN